MGSVTKALEKAVNSMELEKITEVEILLKHRDRKLKFTPGKIGDGQV